MEPTSAKMDRGQRVLPSSPHRLAPAFNHPNMALHHRGLYWLKSLHRDKVERESVIKNVVASKIKRTPARQIKLDVEELDQININLDRRLAIVKRLNERLNRVFEEEKESLDKLAFSFETVMRSNEPKIRNVKPSLMFYFFRRKSQPPLHKMLFGNFDILTDSAHIQKEAWFGSQSDGNSAFPNSSNSGIKTPKQFIAFDKDSKTSPQNMRNQANAFGIAKTEKKQFEAVIREILADSAQHPTSNDHLMRNISLLNFHIAELQKRLSKRRRSSKYSDMLLLAVSNRTMASEIKRLSDFHLRIVREANDQVAQKITHLKASNSSLQEEISEIEDIIKLAEQEILHTEDEIDRLELELTAAENTLDKAVNRNEISASEIARYDDEMVQLIAKIHALSNE